MAFCAVLWVVGGVIQYAAGQAFVAVMYGVVAVVYAFSAFAWGRAA